ncbi:TetR/AcrR family transcriptional regulator [Streptomyces spongiae]|uniref:TetR/AcrR family transcriptional regulator n=1 Tax=Streptomyces spongiae TaxID=565072 RepID=A0A5N8XHY9_9ACTN|nr:TetR/AcrR family transcriptional regulator [Streptomyces spongiae]MPY58598.1 TetR/AcrR family transcriptional regulator [Streptomyces spongiae]
MADTDTDAGSTDTGGTDTGSTDAGAGAKTPRERYRTQVRAEIKERAWEQIATAGASALSLNAIAKRMGMSGPALYRYYAGRDELITELIRDAYRSLADTFRAASASASGADLAALAHALRGWALEDPQRYFLIYGTPVPGYHAPDDVTAIASEIMATLLDACAAMPSGSGSGGDSPETSTATEFGAHIEDLGRQWAAGHPAPPAALQRALTFWTRLHGVLSLELAGHFTGMGFDPALLFAAELDDVRAR